MELRRVSLDDPLVAPLLAGLTDEYVARYGEEARQEMAAAHGEEFEPPTGSFVVLLDDGGVPVAGGGIRSYTWDGAGGAAIAGVAEVKRMWTHTDHRRRGLAAKVLRGLEEEARRLGYTTIRLETGPQQPEAQALYRRLGYTRIDVYGMWPDALAYERRLEGPDEA